MSVSYGFFNSRNGDRKYNAEQMSSIFDGIISDGVYAAVGEKFLVTALDTPEAKVTIHTGRAWFDHVWIYNDTNYTIDVAIGEPAYDRIDAIVFDIDHSSTVRKGSIKYIQGESSSDPKEPDLINEKDHKQYPICFIKREKGEAGNVVEADDIDMVVGKEGYNCPFVTGALESIGIDTVVSRWEAEWNKWYSEITTAGVSNIDDWMAEKKLEFDSWFSAIKNVLDSDVAQQLGERITELEDRFLTLAKEYTIYQVIEDSDGDIIVDDKNQPIEGRIVFHAL